MSMTTKRREVDLKKKPIGNITVTKRRETDPDKLKPTGVVLNRRDLRSFKNYANDYKMAEALYLRENEFVEFDPYIDLERLKILDLSMNMLTGSIKFLPKLPQIRHLYLTSNKIDTLSGVSNLMSLETLCISDNQIASFEGLDGLPSLRLLSMNYNQISSFQAYPHLPSLHTLNLVGNPVVQIPSYREMATALSTDSLVSIDGKAVEPEERAAVEHHKGKVVFCMAEGFVIEGDNVEEAADKFLIDFQRTINEGKPLRLQSIRLASEDAGSNLLTEGVSVKLNLCMQDTRDVETRSTDIFLSSYFFPVVFKVHGEASEAFLVGSMNQWTDPIPLERCEADGDVFYHTTLYLPAGDYEYRYIVDGNEKVSEEHKTLSKYKQGECNIYHVNEPGQVPDPETETILFVRWMRSDPNGGFALIQDENAATYTPCDADIGCCLRAEVLVYIKGDFSFQYFDISTPVSAGPPRCSHLEILGNAAEGETLTVSAVYCGGVEGNSSLAWFRVSADGEEVPLELENPWDGYQLGIDDIGNRIKVTFTPVRDDWVAGAPSHEVTAIVAPGVPSCRSITIVGETIEEGSLVVETVYSGGVEGESQFQWYRHDFESDDYFPIPGAVTRNFTPHLADVGKIIAVEYTPISRDGIEGERCRCVLENPVAPATPELRSIVLRGEPEEQHVLVVDVDYFGGYFGSHHIVWKAREGHSTRQIGRSNTASCTLTSREVGCIIEVTFKPVRSDGVEGRIYHVSTDEPVRAGMPQLKTMEIIGEPKKGNVLEVVAEYFGGEQGSSIIEWARAADSLDFEVVGNNTKKYVIQQEDVGRMLKVTYTPVRKDGVVGEPKQRFLEIPGTRPAPAYSAPPQEEQTYAAPATNYEAAPTYQTDNYYANQSEAPTYPEEPANAGEEHAYEDQVYGGDAPQETADIPAEAEYETSEQPAQHADPYAAVPENDAGENY